MYNRTDISYIVCLSMFSIEYSVRNIYGSCLGTHTKISGLHAFWSMGTNALKCVWIALNDFKTDEIIYII